MSVEIGRRELFRFGAITNSAISVVVQVIYRTFPYFQVFNLGQTTAELSDQLMNVKTEFSHLEEEVIHLVTFKLQQVIRKKSTRFFKIVFVLFCCCFSRDRVRSYASESFSWRKICPTNVNSTWMPHKK